MYYILRRGIWMSRIQKARKDNPAVKAGEAYIKVKKDRFSIAQYFKNDEELNKVYPIKSFNYLNKNTLDILSAYKKKLKTNKNLSPEKFLKEHLQWTE